MTDRVYLAILGIVFLIALAVFLGLVFLTNPETGGFPAVALFYLSLGLVIISAGFFMEIGWLSWKQKNIDHFFDQMHFRTNFLFAFFVLTLFGLARLGKLNVINAVLFFLILLVFEGWMRKNLRKI